MTLFSEKKTNIATLNTALSVVEVMTVDIYVYIPHIHTHTHTQICSSPAAGLATCTDSNQLYLHSQCFPSYEFNLSKFQLIWDGHDFTNN
jgi:hypothetical protein